jgi:thioredoxin-related protein
MRRIFFASIPLVAVAAAITFINDPLPIGATMPKPEVKMKDISGKEVSLNDAKTGKGLLVMFSCNTCPWVIKNQSRTNDVCKYALENGIGVAILNSNEAKRGDDDSYAQMKTYAKEQGYNWYYLVDQNHVLADAFGANRTPECFLFDSNDKLVYHGAIDDNPGDAAAVNRKHLTVAMDEMKAGKEITVKESKSLGCTIKRLK